MAAVGHSISLVLRVGRMSKRDGEYNRRRYYLLVLSELEKGTGKKCRREREGEHSVDRIVPSFFFLWEKERHEICFLKDEHLSALWQG
jgi:hypothetical protein